MKWRRFGWKVKCEAIAVGADGETAVEVDIDIVVGNDVVVAAVDWNIALENCCGIHGAADIVPFVVAVAVHVVFRGAAEDLDFVDILVWDYCIVIFYSLDSLSILGIHFGNGHIACISSTGCVLWIVYFRSLWCCWSLFQVLRF